MSDRVPLTRRPGDCTALPGAVLCLLPPLACGADLPGAGAPDLSLARIVAEVSAPCALPSARIMQFRRFGALSAFKPVDAMRGMLAEPGRYVVVVDCVRVADPATGQCEELHKRRRRVLFDLELQPARRYAFTCRFEGAEIALFYRVSSLADSPPPLAPQ